MHRIPRDYDLDVLGAIAMADGSISAAGGTASGFTSAVGTIVPPSRITIVRQYLSRGTAFGIEAPPASRQELRDVLLRDQSEGDENLLLHRLASQDPHRGLHRGAALTRRVLEDGGIQPAGLDRL